MAFGGLAVGVAAVLVGQAIDLEHPGMLWFVLSGLGFLASFAGIIIDVRGEPRWASQMGPAGGHTGPAPSGVGAVIRDLTPWAVAAVLVLAWALLRLLT